MEFIHPQLSIKIVCQCFIAYNFLECHMIYKAYFLMNLTLSLFNVILSNLRKHAYIYQITLININTTRNNT